MNKKKEYLTDKELQFIDAYFKFYSYSRAYRYLNPTSSTSTAHRKGRVLAKNPLIAKEIERRKKKLSKETKFDLQECIKKNLNIINGNVLDGLERDENGNLTFNPDLLNRDQADAIQQLDITVEEVNDYTAIPTNGKYPTKKQTKYKIKYHDKTKSLKFLAQILGYMDAEKKDNNTLESVLQQVYTINNSDQKIIDVTTKEELINEQ